MSAFVAFLHHIAAFALVAALVVEFMLIRGALTVDNARKLQIADQIFGAAAGIVLIAGVLRVLYFEKGTSYYLSSVPFIAKVSLFALVGLVSIYPTVVFLSWRRDIKQGRAPTIEAAKLGRLRAIIHWELAGIVLLILCAALMAKGVWYLAS
jgi:putative membrane protein